MGVLTLITGVAGAGDLQAVEASAGDGIGLGSTLLVSMLLPLPMLWCGCSDGAGGVGSMISTEVQLVRGNLTSCGLMEGLACV